MSCTKSTNAQRIAADAARMTTQAPAAPVGPRPIKASEILAEIRDEYQRHQEMFLARASRMADELAGAIAHGYDVGRIITNGSNSVEPQMMAAILKRAISRLEGGAVHGPDETFASRLAEIREEAEYELKSVLRSRPWELSSTCQITNVTDRARLSGGVAARQFVENRAARYLNAAKFTIEDDVTAPADGPEAVAIG
jgi:hypothetical protein